MDDATNRTVVLLNLPKIPWNLSEFVSFQVIFRACMICSVDLLAHFHCHAVSLHTSLLPVLKWECMSYTVDSSVFGQLFFSVLLFVLVHISQKDWRTESTNFPWFHCQELGVKETKSAWCLDWGVRTPFSQSRYIDQIKMILGCGYWTSCRFSNL